MKTKERPNYYATNYGRAILAGLQIKDVLFFGLESDNPNTTQRNLNRVAARRAKNKVGRKQRKLNKHG